MRCRRLLTCALFTPLALSSTPTHAQHSVARQWSEALLEAIGNDYAGPTLQARDLFHTSIALYDAWAVYGDGSEPTYLSRCTTPVRRSFNPNSRSSESIFLQITFLIRDAFPGEVE